MSAVLFFIAAVGAITGAIGVVMVRNPFYSVLALVGHLISLAALFLLLRAEFVAAAQVVVYAGAVMVLYVFVVAYVGGQDEPLHAPGGALKALGPLFGRGAGGRAVRRHARLGAEGDLRQGRSLHPRLRHAAPDRHAVSDDLPVPVRARLAAAAGRRDRRRRSRPPPPRPRRGRGPTGVPTGTLGVQRDDGRGRRVASRRRYKPPGRRADRATRCGPARARATATRAAGSGDRLVPRRLGDHLQHRRASACSSGPIRWSSCSAWS